MVSSTTPNKLLIIKARAVALPERISKFLELHAAEIKQMLKINKVHYYYRFYCSVY